MVKIQVGQYIYSHVEVDRSPLAKRRGFQTLFYTKDYLSPEDIPEIESRCFFPEPRGREKFQFYPLRDKFLLAHLIPLEEPDAQFRRGRILAHAFVVREEDFDRFDRHPLVLLEVLRPYFFDNLEEAYRQGDFQTGNLPPLEITLSEQPFPEAGEITLQALERFSQLPVERWVALLRRDSSRSLGIIGFPGDILGFLWATAALVPASWRGNLSFDTDFFECTSLREHHFWAVGFPLPREAPRDPQFEYVHLGTGTLPPAAGPFRPYENWVLWELRHKRHAFLARHTDQALRLEDLLSKKPPAGTARPGSAIPAPGEEALAPDLWGDFFQANRPLILSRLQETLTGWPQRLWPHLEEALLRRPRSLWSWLQGHPDWVLIGEVLAVSLFREPTPKPEPAILNALREAVSQARHPQIGKSLNFWYKLWTKPDDWELRDFLSRLSEEDFQSLLTRLFGAGLTVPGSRPFLGAGKPKAFAAAFVHAWRQLGRPQHLLLQMIELLERGFHTKELHALAQLLGPLTPAELSALQKKYRFRLHCLPPELQRQLATPVAPRVPFESPGSRQRDWPRPEKNEPEASRGPRQKKWFWKLFPWGSAPDREE